ncbi:MAG: esterase family protein [Clostridia bacterium]|nr:esterase family protein [Clostridia bacterium]
MALLHIDSFSTTLNTEMELDVILPETRAQNGWKTLYLLHGMGDDHTAWQRRTSVERYALERGIAVIMPEGHMGWYTDMALGLKYYSYVAVELPKIARQMLPGLSLRREDTWIAGNSMGGYGAFKCALTAPETFSQAASLSGALDVAALPASSPANAHYWRDVFGPTEDINGSANDIFAQASSMRASALRPRMYMWCGTEDFLYSANLRYRDHIRALGYSLTYEESPGDHQWKYWDAKLPHILDWFMEYGKEDE